ncbi:MAG: heparin lyase I family protein, partial [Phycicoccus sp.]
EENTCQKFENLLDVSTVRGRWLDIVLDLHHTDEADGALRLWVKPEGGDWQLVLDYAGATWWETDAVDPNLKVGLYTGDPNNVATTLRYYTDEFRVGNAQATIADVSPDGSEPSVGP